MKIKLLLCVLLIYKNDLTLLIIRFYWFKNYLNYRKQCVKINGCIYKFLSIVMGILQRSILDPVLFLLFINDLPNVNVIYLPMTPLYVQSSSLDEAESKLQKVIENLMIWLDMNRLHVNASKLSCMVLSTHDTVRDFNLTINDDFINVDNDVKYIGVYVANDLSWVKYVLHVCIKVVHGLQILYRFWGIVPINDMITIYKTIIQPQINNVITI